MRKATINTNANSNEEAPKNPLENSDYQTLIRRSSLFQNQPVSFTSHIAAAPDLAIDFKLLFGKLPQFKNDPRLIPAFFMIWNEKQEFQIIAYRIEGNRHSFSPITTFINDKATVLRYLSYLGVSELKEGIEEILLMGGTWEEINRILSDGDCQCFLISNGGLLMARYLFEELNLRPHFDKVWSSAIYYLGLLNYLWEKYPEGRKAFPRSIKNPNNHLLKFLLSKREALYEEGFAFELTRELIQFILHSDSLPLIQLLCQTVGLNGDYCLEVNTIEKFKLVLPHCNPTLRTLRLLTERYFREPSHFNRQVISLFLDFVQLEQFVYRRKPEVFYRAAALFPEKPISQEFFYDCLINSELPWLNEKEGKDFIRKHSEWMAYRPLLRACIDPSKKQDKVERERSLKQLFLACGKSEEALGIPLGPMSDDETRRMRKLKEVLSLTHSERLLAHIFILQLQDHAGVLAFMEKAKTFGREKIYLALMEQVDLIQENNLKIDLLQMALESGLFENKKNLVLFGSNFYRNIVEKINTLQKNRISSEPQNAAPPAFAPREELLGYSEEEEAPLMRFEGLLRGTPDHDEIELSELSSSPRPNSIK